MLTIQFGDLWKSSAELILENGKHQRRKTYDAHPSSKTHIAAYQNVIPGFPTWSWLEIRTGEETNCQLEIEDARLLSQHTETGLTIESRGTYFWFPKAPRALKQDDQGRIRVWDEIGWEIRLEGAANIVLHFSGQKQSLIEVGFLTFEDDQDLRSFQESHEIEETKWAVEGCWSNLVAPQDFWEFWALGNVYSGRFANYGRFPSAQTSWSMFKIADALEKQTGKAIYEHLKAELSYMALAHLGADGNWANGEWLEEMETHSRFQVDGVHLLTSAYQHFGDESFLEGAHRAADYVLKNKDLLDGDNWWFLHDSLEMSPQIQEKYPQMLIHTAYGKHKWNTLTLNTHVQALTMFFRLGVLSSEARYLQAYEKGLSALRVVLASSKGNYVHKLAASLLSLSFEKKPASLLRRGMRRFVRTNLTQHLSKIQKRWPRFVVPNGYLWRDASLPNWGYWYHLVNLYDLLVLYQLDPHPWLRDVIDQAMAFALESNLVNYLIAQNHYIVPQWLQILKAYSSIAPDFDRGHLERATETLKQHGYGLPPEIFRSSGSFLEA